MSCSICHHHQDDHCNYCYWRISIFIVALFNIRPVCYHRHHLHHLHHRRLHHSVTHFLYCLRTTTCEWLAGWSSAERLIWRTCGGKLTRHGGLFVSMVLMVGFDVGRLCVAGSHNFSTSFQSPSSLQPSTPPPTTHPPSSALSPIAVPEGYRRFSYTSVYRSHGPSAPGERTCDEVSCLFSTKACATSSCSGQVSACSVPL